MSLGVYGLMDRVEPLHHTFVELATGKVTRQVADIILQILQDILAGYLAGIMPTHTIGQGNDETVNALRLQFGLISFATYKCIVSEDHVLVVASHASNTAGCR